MMVWHAGDRLELLLVLLLVLLLLFGRLFVATFGDRASVLLGQMGLIVFRKMCLLAEALSAQRTCKRFLAGVRSNVNVYRVLVFESFRADRTVVQGAFFSGWLTIACRIGIRCALSGTANG